MNEPISKSQKKSKKSLQTTKSLLSFWLEAFAAITVIVIISIIFILMLDSQQADTVAKNILEIKIDALVQRLSQTLTNYRTTLNRIAVDPNLLVLLKSKDRKLIAANEQVLVKIIPNALRVRLLEVGHEITDDTEPPLSYASLALLRVTETTKQLPPLEIHQTKDKRLYLVGAVALRDSIGQEQGVLHVMWNASVITKEINLFGINESKIVLQQKVNDKLATIFGTVPTNVEIINSNKSRPLAASEMQIVYWYTGSADMPLLIPSILIMGCLILVYSLILGVQYWRLYQAITIDQSQIIKALEEIFAGRKPKNVAISMREFTNTVEFLVQTANTLSGKFAPSIQKKSATEVNAQGISAKEVNPEMPATLVTDTQQVEKVPELLAEATPAEPTASIQKSVSVTAKTGRPVESAVPSTTEIPEVLFRTYDIRGLITTSLAYEIGRAVGSKLQELGQQSVSVSRDNREAGDDIMKSLIEGLVNSGRDVINLGVTTVPIGYFATRYLDSSAGIIVTAGRSPVDYNGFKILIDGEMVIESELLAIRQLALKGPLWQGLGSQREQDLLPAYIERIADDVSIARPLKVVVDGGNGCAGLVAPQLFKTLGCEVVELFCELDPTYPNHQPDPIRPENLKLLQASVLSEHADLGLAFDAEGDRIGVIDSKGRIIWPDRLLMALAADILTRNPGGDVIFDVNCSRALSNQILQNGGRPIMWRAGHPALKAKLRGTQALLAGDWSGHIIFQERWYGFDDACYVGARLLEILAVDPRSSAEFFNEYPDSVSTPEFTLKLREGEQIPLIKQLQKYADSLQGARLITMDGTRAEYEGGWGLVRVSNTTPALRFRFEADNEQVLERIQKSYRELLAMAAPKLKAPF